MPDYPFPQGSYSIYTEDSLLFQYDIAAIRNIYVARCMIRNLSQAVEENEAAHACTDIEKYGYVTENFKRKRMVRILMEFLRVKEEK